MTRLMILAIAMSALVGTATMWWHAPLAVRAETAGMPSLQELHVMAGVNKLPNHHVEDRSVEFLPDSTQ
ncbi:hypothetical protein ACFFWD_10250 [Bradyrhizobium erythrophlei]|uniref:hypothetical protein n=1 Tax=Bradyrhizobium erythrophlei TaxID=1437360 RepID=UPI0035E8C922